MMLQLVQSPSPSLQRLIERECQNSDNSARKDAGVGTTSISKDDSRRRDQQVTGGLRAMAVEDDQEIETASEGNSLDATDALTGLHSVSPEENLPEVHRTEKVVDNSKGLIVTSASYISSTHDESGKLDEQDDDRYDE